MGERQQVFGQRVLADEIPCRVEVFGAGEGPLAELAEGAVHRVERVDRRGEHGVFDELVKRLREFGVVSEVDSGRRPSSEATSIELRVSVPVLSTQIAVADPRVSMTAERRVST